MLLFQACSSYIVHKVYFNLLSLCFTVFSIPQQKFKVYFHVSNFILVSYWQLYTGNINSNIFIKLDTVLFMFIIQNSHLKLISTCERKTKFTQEGNISPLIAKYKHRFHYHYRDHLSLINLLQFFKEHIASWLIQNSENKIQSTLKYSMTIKKHSGLLSLLHF